MAGLLDFTDSDPFLPKTFFVILNGSVFGGKVCRCSARFLKKTNYLNFHPSFIIYQEIIKPDLHRDRNWTFLPAPNNKPPPKAISFLFKKTYIIVK